MAIQGLLQASSALSASQESIDVTGTNLSNLSTNGYVQQSIDPLSTPVVVPGGGQPNGQVIGDTFETDDPVQSSDNQYLDQAWRAQNSADAGSQATSTTLSSINSLFDLSSGQGVSADVSGLLDDFQSASTSPQDLSLRQTVLSQAQSVANDFNATASGLQQAASQTSQQLAGDVQTVNSILSQLAQLNVGQTGPATTQSNAVLNQRGVLLDSLSQYLDVQVANQPSGSVVVYQNGTPLVFGNTARQLSVTLDGGGQTTLTTDTGKTLASPQGEMGALTTMVNTTIPQLQSKLDAQSEAVAGAINGMLANGTDLNNQAGQPLFSGNTAATMQVAISDPSSLALATSQVQSTSAITTGTIDPTAALSSLPLTVPLSGSGTISVNGTPISYTASESLNTFLGSLSTAGVQASFDSTTQTVVLTQDPAQGTNGPGITVSDVSGNLGAALQLNGAPVNNGVPGDGGVATAISNLATTPAPGATETLVQGLDGLSSSVATTTSEAQDGATNDDALLASVTSQRQSVEGVSSDQQATLLMQYQSAYQATLKLVNVQDTILDDLINNTADMSN